MSPVTDFPICPTCGRRYVPWGFDREHCEACQQRSQPMEPPVARQDVPRPESPVPGVPLQKREAAIVWLAAQLADGAVACFEVERRAKAASISQRTLRRAKKLLDVRSLRVGGLAGAGFWGWILPPEEKSGN